MSVSAKIVLRKDYGRDEDGNPIRTLRNGMCSVLLRVTIDRKPLRYPLEAAWWPDHWDDAAGKALPRHRGDTDANDVNLKAGKALGEANAIFRRYALDDADAYPTWHDFRREFRSTLSRKDFLEYYAAKCFQRFRTGEIDELTYTAQMGSHKALKGCFGEKLPFANLVLVGFAARFEAWLVTDAKKTTTRWARHKDARTYLNLARKVDRINFPWPYDEFKARKGKSGRRPLSQHDVELLDDYYQRLLHGQPARRVLRRFLFSLASCGMRISDAKRVERQWRFENVLIFKPWKGRRRSDRQIQVLLAERAMELWDEALAEQDHSHYVFTNLSGDKSNGWLKEIAAELGITSDIFNHQARKTFGSLYVANGGLLPHLQDYFGHVDISSTMIYVEPMPAQRKLEAKKVDAIFTRRRALPAPERPAPPAPSLQPLSWHLRRNE